jgi:tetratricopeptide (TPR) repeat protein
MDQKLYPLAEEKLKASFEKDPNFLPALVKLTSLMYRNMMYVKALDLARRALAIDTHDGSANFYYGLVNASLNHVSDAKDGFSLATLDPQYRSAAYTELSRLYLKEKRFQKAIDYAKKAEEYNRFNMEALQLQALCFRFLNDPSGEAEALKCILSFDPLNHFARFENYLVNPEDENREEFISLIRNELPYETFMDLAVWYYNAGCISETEKVLSLSPVTPEVTFWLAFLNNEKVDCSGINPEFSFPFRSETAFVLEQLLAGQHDWMLKYQLALIYHDRNRLEECRLLFSSCGDLPDFAPFYVSRAEVFKGIDEEQCETDLIKALSLNGHWRYVRMLTNHYIDQRHYDKALSITEPFYQEHPENYILGMTHAKTLIFNNMYEETDRVLAQIEIIPYEGATDGHELHREVKLMQAVRLLEKNNARAALKFIDEARDWPENLGVGKPYSEDIDTRLEDWMSYLCFVQLKKTQEAVQLLNSIIQFEPKVESTVRNFFPSNAIITAWAYQKLNRNNDAVQWLDNQIKEFPDQELIIWSRALFENDDTYLLNDSDKDVNTRLIERLIQNKLITSS